jgi:hypothetical protein
MSIQVLLRTLSDIDSGNAFTTDDNGLMINKRANLPHGRPGDEDAGVSLAGAPRCSAVGPPHISPVWITRPYMP